MEQIDGGKGNKIIITSKCDRNNIILNYRRIIGFKTKINKRKQAIYVCMHVCVLSIFNIISVCSYSSKLYSWVKSKKLFIYML